jgi:hypothetical protein
MAMSDDELDLYLALQDKLFVLTQGSQHLLKQLNSGNAATIQAALDRATLEFKLVENVMSKLSNGLPIQMPPASAFDALRASTAAVAEAVKKSAAWDAAINALDDAIDAWPHV